MALLAGVKVLSCDLTAAEGQPPWPFGVTASGGPAVRIPLLDLRKGEIVEGLSLKHALIFSGGSYASRLVIPELESYLISSGPRQLEWQMLGGGTILLRVGEETMAAGRGWKLVDEGGDRVRVVASDGGESYTSERCILTFAERAGTRYHFERPTSRQLRILSGKLAAANPVLSIVYDDRGAVTRVQVGESDLRFEYGGNLELVKFMDAVAPGKIWRFAYRNRLLTTISAPTGERRFVWGDVVHGEYFARAVPLPPVVVDDGRFAYQAQVDQRCMTFFFQAIAGGLSGRWDVDLKTAQLNLTMQKK